MYALSINVQENIICDPTKITDLHKKDQISSNIILVKPKYLEHIPTMSLLLPTMPQCTAISETKETTYRIVPNSLKIPKGDQKP
jgi:hypothetical protein